MSDVLSYNIFISTEDAWPKSSCILNINFAVIFNLLINIKIDENSYKVACNNVEQLISSKNQFNFLNEVK